MDPLHAKRTSPKGVIFPRPRCVNRLRLESRFTSHSATASSVVTAPPSCACACASAAVLSVLGRQMR